MAEMKLRAIGTELKILGPFNLVSTQQNYDSCVFNFDTSWDGFVKTAVFYSDTTDKKSMSLDSENKCLIPWENLINDGILYIGVFGIKDTTILPTNWVSHKLKEGSYVGADPSQPTQDIYAQLISDMNAFRNAEADRVIAENERIANENARKTNEDNRINAEIGRINDNINWSNAENKRITAENERKALFDSMIKKGYITPKTPVSTFSDIAITYPSPELGWTVKTLDTGNIYRFDGTTWMWSDTITSSSYDALLSKMGDLTQLHTESNTDLVGAINENTENMVDINTKLNANATRIVDLFAMSGQSNMQGQSESAPTPFEIPQYQAYEYKLLSDSLTTVKHPFGEDIGTLLLGAHKGWGSLSPRFAESYFNTTGIPPLMVGVAKGSTNISQWQKTGTESARYAKVVEKVNSASTHATSDGLIVRNKYFVWLQGESDGIASTTKQTYKNSFLTFWNDLKADCGFTKCLIIRVAKFYNYNVAPIIKAQEELARENDDIVMLTRITGTFTIENGLMQDIWHYTNAGLDLVGSTAGNAIGKYINSNVKPILETEPYTEVITASKGQYSWNFRDGTSVGDITLVNIGSPVTTTFVSLNGSSGFKLSKDITLDGDATVSITCLFTSPASNYAMLLSYDGDINRDFIFWNKAKLSFNIADSKGNISRFSDTSDIVSTMATYNHYVIHKIGSTYSLYVNGKYIQSIFNGANVLNVNNLFYSLSNYGIQGKVKHCMINRGSLISPKDADPTFYSGNEQGTV